MTVYAEVCEPQISGSALMRPSAANSQSWGGAEQECDREDRCSATLRTRIRMTVKDQEWDVPKTEDLVSYFVLRENSSTLNS